MFELGLVAPLMTVLRVTVVGASLTVGGHTYLAVNNGDATWTMGDVNGDGQINLLDYGIVKANFGQTAPAPLTSAVPAQSGVVATGGASMTAWTWPAAATGAVVERERIDAAQWVLDPKATRNPR